MDNDRTKRRARMLEKVRKLLAMGKGNANAHESETAMRQANILMAEFGIEEAECDMTAINAGEMIFGETQCGPDGRAPQEGKVYKTCPTWCGVLGVGVARFTDSICGRKTTANGEMFYFRGEKEDVLLARWIFGVLVDSIQLEQKKSGWTSRGDAGTFRLSAASTLQTRLKTLANERRAIYQKAQAESNSRALVVVDRKQQEIAIRFGTQKVRNTRSSYRSSGAAMSGSEAGRRINIPSGRPIGQSNRAALS